MKVRTILGACMLAVIATAALADPIPIAPPPTDKIPAGVPIRPWSPEARKYLDGPYYPTRTTPRNDIMPFTGNFVMPENPVWKGPRFDPTGQPQAPMSVDQANPLDAAPLINNFHGEGVTNLTPPDPDIAAGPNYIMTTVNSRFAIFDKCGNRIVEQDISSFLGDTTSFIFDPRVIYDPWNGRWVMQWHAQRSASSQAWLVICVSATSDPLGGWWFYYFPATTGSGSTLAWNDYYNLGYGAQAVYSAGNQFTFSGSQFTNATIHTYNKSEIYNALTAFQRVDTGLQYASGGLAFTPRAAKMQVTFGGSSGANLVNNPGFETGDLSGWTVTGSTSFFGVGTGTPHSGTYACYMGATSSSSQNQFSQTIPTVAGARYQVSFWGYQNGGDNTNSNLQVTFNGINLVNGQLTPSYALYTNTFTATGASTVLQITGWNSPAYFYVDDFEVVRIGEATDGMFAASRPGGGTQVSFYRLYDPLGAHQFTSFEIPVGAYTAPIDATQPSGATLDTIDSRLLSLVVTAFGTPGNSAFSGLNTMRDFGGGNLPSARLFVFDPFSTTPRLDTDFGAAGLSYWFPDAAADYLINGVWTFARTGAGAGQYAEQRYVSYETGTFTSSSVSLKTGVASYNGNRWGDYFAADVDWSDYFGTSSAMKVWMFGEYGFSSNAWDTWVGATVVNANPGTMTVTAGNFNTVGLVGGPFNPANITYTVGNAGDVGYTYMLSGLPAWLDASETGGEVVTGGARNVTISTNATTNTLAFGRYSANLTFTNCYNGSSIVRQATAEVDAIVHPNSITLNPGIIISGNVNSLQANDSNRLIMRPGIVLSSTQAPIQLVCDMTAPASNVGSMLLHIISNVNQANIGETLRLFNWGANSYEQLNFRNPTTSDTEADVLITGNPNRFINGSNQIRAKIDYKTTGPVLNYPWQARVNEVRVELTPP